MITIEGCIMTELDDHRDTGGSVSFAKGRNDHAKLMQLLHKLDDEMSQLIRDTPATPIPACDDGIRRSTADVKVALITIAPSLNALAIVRMRSPQG
jgi:hypothetical protein